MLDDVDFSWFDSGLLDLNVGTSGDMDSCDTVVAAHDRANDNADSTLTSNRYLGSIFRTRSEAYQRCDWTSWHPLGSSTASTARTLSTLAQATVERELPF